MPHFQGHDIQHQGCKLGCRLRFHAGLAFNAEYGLPILEVVCAVGRGSEDAEVRVVARAHLVEVALQIRCTLLGIALPFDLNVELMLPVPLTAGGVHQHDLV
ncbi:hypothetical protein IID10_17820 [candidate division KSB1 bacterium]|nr:hypothetical protein [candidate division KSB1 bacterium]